MSLITDRCPPGCFVTFCFRFRKIDFRFIEAEASAVEQIIATRTESVHIYRTIYLSRVPKIIFSWRQGEDNVNMLHLFDKILLYYLCFEGKLCTADEADISKVLKKLQVSH